jgi:ABC-type nitrate/sulfonate/bicarbonate transport system substrate-binding protein
VTVAEAATGLTFLQFRVAKAKGFDRENGIDVEFQTIGGTPGVQAMMAGALDFTMSAGSVLNAALNGAPVTALMISVDKSVYSLYARPEIKSVQDLRGFTVGVGAIGDSQYKELGIALGKLGMSLNDMRVVGLPGVTHVAAIESGAADAVVVAPPLDIQLEQTGAGYHRLINLGDHVVGINGGLGASRELLQAKPELVDAMVTASLMGFRYVLENREGTLPVIMDYGQVDAETAARLYDTMVKSYSDGPGKSSPATRAEIVQQAAELLDIPAPAQPDALFEFGPLDRATAKLQASGWRPTP